MQTLTNNRLPAFLINGDEDHLLKEVSKQNKAALFQLVMIYMPYIISVVERVSSPWESFTGLVDAATNEVIKLIEANASDLHAGNLNPHWQDEIFKQINTAIYLSAEGTFDIDKIHRKTPKHIAFLNQMNRLLTEKEKEIIIQAISFLELGEQMRKAGNTFTVDFMVQTEIHYYTNGSDYPSHIFSDYFDYRKTVIEKDYGLLLNEEIKDWRECYMPELSEPYCYLLHDLIDHSRLGNKLFEINRIWIDIHVTAQQGLKIQKNGNSRFLRLTRNGFE